MIAEHWFPDFHGWNPYFFLGAVDGVHYPPLFHWLVAGLSYCFTLPTAYRLLISAALLACWPSVYFFLRQYKYKREGAALGATALFAYQCLSRDNTGGNLVSTLITGNSAEIFSLPFLFLFAATIPDMLRGRRSWTAVCFFSIIILTHLVTAAFAAFLLAGFLLHHPIRQSWLNTVLFLGRSFLICAFWLLPFFLYSDGSLIYPTGNMPLNFLELGLLTATIVYALPGPLASLRRVGEPLALALIVTLGVLLLNSLAGHLLPFHYPRFKLFIVSFSLLSLAGVMNQISITYRRSLSVTLQLMLVLLISIFGLEMPSARSMPAAPPAFPVLTGRVLSVSDPELKRPRHQDLYYPAD